MTAVNLFDALEICLQALDQGMDLESCLARFPALADDLRPLLTAAIQARSSAVTDVPADALRRGRARVLQAAAEMREQSSAAPAPLFRGRSQKGFFGARFFRLAITTAVMLVFLLTGGTGLVNASNNALPGDHLYPVKRSWEGVRLLFVFDPKSKVELENEFDHERVQEIEELYTKNKIEQVNFQGVVNVQNSNRWVIDGLEIAIDEDTSLGANIRSGSTVQVIGETDDGLIKAEQINLIATPTAGPSPTFVAPSQPEALHTAEPTEMRDDTGDDSKESEDAPKIADPTKKPEDDGPELKPVETRHPDDKKSDDGGNDKHKDGGDSGSGDNGGDGGDNGGDGGDHGGDSGD